MKASLVQKDFRTYAKPSRKKSNEWFFKTAKGQYGYGDQFIGVRMSDLRVVAKNHKDLPLPEVKKLLYSKIHEDRLCALIILTYQYKNANENEQRAIYEFYLKHIKQVNNWDLVDSSAHKIVGEYMYVHKSEQRKLSTMARSKNLWERRIAIIATAAFISKGSFAKTLMLARQLLRDDQDLMHKAVGWMLREVGKRDLVAEETFLKKHYMEMPRTMLRYAIEKFPEVKRKAYLHGRVTTT